MKNVIEVNQLGKRYIIGHTKQSTYSTFRETLTEKSSSLLRHLIHPKKSQYEEGTKEAVWALKDVSFNVGQGEKVGIIGRNGAGKTTLLKILSRITEPTKGSAVLRGKVASLLEVGTGFHNELTGRENIFLNGAILGMSHRDIKKKFDQIVAFSEVEKYLDTPMKRYSSGMSVRLAFSIAAHLEPEILIVDEVLAVGDFEFQKKCLGKMQDVSKEGRTILFVSHRMSHITALCNKAILLDRGGVVKRGEPVDVVDYYYNSGWHSSSSVDFTKGNAVVGNDKVRLLKGRVLDENENEVKEVLINKPFTIEMEYQVLKNELCLNPNFHFYNQEGVLIFASSDAIVDPKGDKKKEKGTYLARCTIPAYLMNDGLVYVGLAVSTMSPVEVHFYEKDCLRVHILDPIHGNITRGLFVDKIPGAVRPKLDWKSEKIGVKK